MLIWIEEYGNNDIVTVNTNGSPGLSMYNDSSFRVHVRLHCLIQSCQPKCVGQSEPKEPRVIKACTCTGPFLSFGKMLSKRHSRNFLFFTLEIFYFYFFYFIPKATSLYLSKAFIASWCTKKK